jgi:hypothetical protein
MFIYWGILDLQKNEDTNTGSFFFPQIISIVL